MSQKKSQSHDVMDAEVVEHTTSIVPVSKAEAYLPALTLDEADKRYQLFKGFVASQMMDGKDFGTIPGTAKPTLYKPGAEKLTTFFGLTVKFVPEKTIEDFDKPLFFYRIKCQLWRGDMLIAEASGSCNSMEDRYAWRWVQSQEVPPNLDRATLEKKVSSIGEWKWAYEKRKTSGDYGKPEEYWEKFDKALETGIAKVSSQKQHWDGKHAEYIEIESAVYRIPNENIFTLVNTILKMAEKRALVAATLIGCNASEFFTQDMEDIMDAEFDVDVQPSAPQREEPKAEPARKSDPRPSTGSVPSDLKTLVSELGAKAANGELSKPEYSTLCNKLGFGREQTAILNNNNGDQNAAALEVIGRHTNGDDYVPDLDPGDIPF